VTTIDQVQSPDAAGTRACSPRLPDGVAVLADAGLLLAPILVLLGSGPIGLWLGIALGAASLAGLLTHAVLSLQRAAPVLSGSRQPTLAPARVTVWGKSGRRAA
jgi:hypothetical protein